MEGAESGSQTYYCIVKLFTVVINSHTIDGRIHTMAIVPRQQCHTIILHAPTATLNLVSIGGGLEIGFAASLGKWRLRAQEVSIESGQTRENVRWAAI